MVEQRVMDLDVPQRMEAVKKQIDAGLTRYLTTSGEDRQRLLVELLRLKWAEEELAEGAAGEDRKGRLATQAGTLAANRLGPSFLAGGTSRW